MKHKFTFIDLFSGIGGFRLALGMLDGKCVFSSDIDKWANETYFANFLEMPSGDISKIPSSEIPDHDILTAGFPCQPFSIAGKRKGFEDTRGTLFFDVARILKDKKPKAFILENVRGIVSHDKGNTLATILLTLDELGYRTEYKVLNSKDFGVPQNRERWICVGTRKELNVTFEFPEPEKLSVTLWDILDHKSKVEKISPIALKNLASHTHKIKKSDLGKKQVTVATEIRPSRVVFRNDGISPCLTAKMGTGGNNVPVYVEKERKFTIEECLAIQGFPRSFIMPNQGYQGYKQIGNSVTVTLINKVAANLVKLL
jgi:DNA (cytosine-5)-methyltransferase 1